METDNQNTSIHLNFSPRTPTRVFLFLFLLFTVYINRCAPSALSLHTILLFHLLFDYLSITYERHHTSATLHTLPGYPWNIDTAALRLGRGGLFLYT